MIAFTGFAVTDMKRAKGFYEGVLGLTRSRGFGHRHGEDQWAEYDLASGRLALIGGGGRDEPPSTGGAAALEVSDFDACVAAVKASGVKVIRPPREARTCRKIVVADPDGNWVVLHQPKLQTA